MCCGVLRSSVMRDATEPETTIISLTISRVSTDVKQLGEDIQTKLDSRDSALQPRVWRLLGQLVKRT